MFTMSSTGRSELSQPRTRPRPPVGNEGGPSAGQCNSLRSVPRRQNSAERGAFPPSLGARSALRFPRSPPVLETSSEKMAKSRQPDVSKKAAGTMIGRVT
jgi:hypothetical protein